MILHYKDYNRTMSFAHRSNSLTGDKQSMNEYEAYIKQTRKHTKQMTSNDPYTNYVLAKLDRNRMILYEDQLDNVINSAAEKAAHTALDTLDKLLNGF